MKRKIAILLSAMMVTSAMPITASAAQLKSDSVQNTTFAKSGETIDPNASKYQTNINTIDDLQGRRSVIKINLNDDGTDKIEKGTSFYVELENGTFGNLKSSDNANTSEFGYINSNGSTAVKYDAVKDATSLTDAYNKIAGNSEAVTPTYDLGQKIDVTAVPNLQDSIKGIVTGATDNTLEQEKALISEINAVGSHNVVDGIVGTFKTETEASNKYPQLLHIPYSIEIVSPTKARVSTLFDMSNSDKKITVPTAKTVDVNNIGLKFYKDGGNTEVLPKDVNTEKNNITHVALYDRGEGVKTTNKDLENPYIALPLGGVIADGDGAVKAKVTADYTDKVVGGEYTITKGESGSTNLVYDANNVKSFDDLITLSSLTLKENVRNTIGKDTGTDGIRDEAKIVLRLGSGFTFKDPSKITIKDASGKNNISSSIKFNYVGAGTKSENKSAIEATITGLTDRNNPIGLDFGNIEIEPVSENRYGDVEITVSGDNVTTQTVKVAQREKLGFKLETLKDPKEIISGRHYSQNKLTMTEQDNTTVDVKFSETVPNTLVNQRALDFTLPEGVKFVNAEITNYKGFKNGNPPEDTSFEIRDNGRTLRLKRVTDTDKHYEVDGNNRLAEFTMKLNLSVDPAFSGEIKLGVTGGGQSDVTETVIAKAVLPFEIKTQTTKLNMGYQDYNTADIVITETRPGMFLEGKDAILSLAAPYGTHELGFSEAKFEVSGGELEVKEKDFKVGNKAYSDVNGDNIFDGRGTINFKINKASYKNPSTITIKNVKVGTTRSVPFGAYDLKLHGDAVINNYASKIDEEKVVQLPAAKSNIDKDLVLQNNTSSYDYKAYVDVITETGTFDQTVKVSVGEKTVLVGDKAIDMDVAPYIQASSNSTMVPLRFVSVALGVDSANVTNPDASNKVAWDANTKTTTIYYGAGTGQKIIQFQDGSNIMTVDGTRIPMEYGVKAEIKDGRMFVPFRALGQALGVNVTWDANTRTAIYNENNARNANITTTNATTTTASSSTTTESTTESTTASTTSDSTTTESTTAKQ